MLKCLIVYVTAMAVDNTDTAVDTAVDTAFACVQSG